MSYSRMDRSSRQDNERLQETDSHYHIDLTAGGGVFADWGDALRALEAFLGLASG
jgi:hypothetical protein